MNENDLSLLKEGLQFVESGLKALSQSENPTVSSVSKILETALHIGELVIGK